MARKSAKAVESATSPEPSKVSFGDEALTTDVGAWGRWMAPRGL